jgi:hypothetical protein
MRKLIATCIALSFLSAGAAFAQDKKEGDGKKVEYKKKTTYDFEDDMVEGELLKPEGDVLSARKRGKTSSLIKIRENFVPEMVKSVDDL